MSEDATLDEFINSDDTESDEMEEEGLREEGFLTLPYGWDISTVDEVAKEGGLVDGDWIESADMDEDGEVQLVQLAHIGEGQFKGETDRFITKEFAEQEDCTILSEGDLIISRMQEPILRACLLPSFEQDSIMAVDIARLQEKKEWNRHFLKYLFNSRPIWKQGIAWASGTTRKRISRKNIEKLRLPTPPLSEQRKIATVLYTVDQAIQKTEEIIEQTERVKTGIAQNLFHYGIDGEETKEAWVGEIPKSWDVVQFSEIVDSNRNGLYKSEEAYGSGYPIAKMGNALENRVLDMSSADRLELTEDEKQKYVLNKNDLIFARRAQEVSAAGDCCYVPELAEPTVFESSLIRVRLTENVNPKFYVQYFEGPVGSRSIERIVTETSISGIATSDLLDLKVALPSLEEQNEIATILWGFDEQVNTLRKEADQYRRLKRGLMQDLLSGNVRTNNTNIEVPEEIAQHG